MFLLLSARARKRAKRSAYSRMPGAARIGVSEATPGTLVPVLLPGVAGTHRLPLPSPAHALEDQLVHLQLHRHWVFAGEAGCAEAALRLLNGPHQTLDRQVGETVRADVRADLFHALPRGDKLPLGCHIDAEVTGVPHRRGEDAHVHLACPGPPKH